MTHFKFLNKYILSKLHYNKFFFFWRAIFRELQVKFLGENIKNWLSYDFFREKSHFSRFRKIFIFLTRSKNFFVDETLSTH